jgi:hypothetical protein
MINKYIDDHQQQQQQQKLTGGLGFRGFCFCCLALCLLDYLYSNYL